VRATSRAALRFAAPAVAAALVLAGCASRNGTAARSATPPTLHLANSDIGAAATGAEAPMVSRAEKPALGGPSIFGEFVLVGALPDEPTHAPVWRWAPAAATRDEVVKLGHTVGIVGTPQRHTHGWLLTSTAGELRVTDTAGHEWAYARADLLSCSPHMIDIDNPPPNGSGSGCAIATSSDQQVANGPDDAASRAAAAPVFSGLGLQGAEQVEVGAPTSYVSISPLVGGLLTQGLETSVEVDTKGIRSAHGRLSMPAVGTDYPLRTAKQAFDDLRNRPQPMMAMPYCGPVGPNQPAPPVALPPARESASTSSGGAAGQGIASPKIPSGSGIPSASVGGAPVPACPTPKPQRVTGASIGLQLTYEGSGIGSALLVPAWFFTVEGWTSPTAVIAVDPAFLDSGNPTQTASSTPGQVDPGVDSTLPNVIPPGKE
jgi:hypothetical protein